MPIPKNVSVEEQFLADESGSWDEEVSVLGEKKDEEHSPAEEFESSSRQHSILKRRRKPYVHPERIPRHIPIQPWTGENRLFRENSEFANSVLHIPQKLGRRFGPQGGCRTWKQLLNNFLPTVSERARLKAKAIEGKKQSRRFGRIAHVIPRWDANVLALYNALVFAVFLKLLDIAAANSGVVWEIATSSLGWIPKVQG